MRYPKDVAQALAALTQTPERLFSETERNPELFYSLSGNRLGSAIYRLRETASPGGGSAPSPLPELLQNNYLTLTFIFAFTPLKVLTVMIAVPFFLCDYFSPCRDSCH